MVYEADVCWISAITLNSLDVKDRKRVSKRAKKKVLDALVLRPQVRTNKYTYTL